MFERQARITARGKWMFTKFGCIQNWIYVIEVIILIPVIAFTRVKMFVLFGTSIDDMFNRRQFAYSMFAFMLISFITYLADKIILPVIEERLFANVTIALHHLLIDKMHNIKYSLLLSKGKADLFQMCSKDIYNIKEMSLHVFVQFLIEVVTGVLATIKLASINALFPCAAMAIYTISIVIVKPIGKVNQKCANAVRENEQTLAALFFELLDRFALIKMFGKNEEQIYKIGLENEKYNSNIIKSKICNNFYKTIARIMNAMAPIAIILIGGAQYVKGNISAGQIITAVALLSSICSPIQSFGEIFIHIRGLWFKIQNIADFLRLEDEPITSTAVNELSGNLVFSDVCYEANQISILNHVSFSIPYGKKTAIIGQTGSGKSTITNIMSGLLESNSGEIKFGDTRITEANRSSIRRSISYVHSTTFLLNDTVKNNLSLGGTDEANLSHISAALGLDEIISELPNKGDTFIGSNGHKLSGGQEKRLGLVRGLSMDRNYYLLDEATTGLDNKSAMRVNDFLLNQMHGRTLIVITHDLDRIRDFDHIILIHKGKVCKEGSHKQLYSTCKEYEELYNGKKH